MRSDEPETLDEDDEELIRALKQLAAEEVPEDFLTRVMARTAVTPLELSPTADALQTAHVSDEVEIRDRPALRFFSRRRTRGLRPWLAPSWVGALAAFLLLSLAVNVWLGVHTFDPQAPSGSRHLAQDDHQAVRALLASLQAQDKASVLQAFLFLSSIKTQEDLGTLAAAHSAIENRSRTLGFVTTSAFYTIGAWYVEALAYVQGDKYDVAAQRLAFIERELNRWPHTSSLTTYLQTMRQALVQKQYTRTALGEALALFQPLFEAYARDQGVEALTLFRAGIWLANMRLAAAAGDTALLHQDAIVKDFLREMASLNAPPQILDTLEQLRILMVKPMMSDNDLQEVLTLVSNLQRLLG